MDNYSAVVLVFKRSLLSFLAMVVLKLHLRVIRELCLKLAFVDLLKQSCYLLFKSIVLLSQYLDVCDEFCLTHQAHRL